MVGEPVHGELEELLIEEFLPELLRQERHVLDYGQTHTPLPVLGQIDDCWEKGVLQFVRPDHIAHLNVLAT